MQLASLIFFSFREKQIMCRNICSHLTIFPLTHLITSFNQESRKNLTDSKPKFQKTFLIRTLWNRDYKMFLQKPLDGFVKALKQLFFFSKLFFSLDRFQVWHLTWHFDEDFFFGLSFYHKNRVLIFKEVWNAVFFLYSNCYFWYVKKLSW